MARIARRYRKKHKKNPSSSPRSNPTAVQDVVEFVAPGFAAYAVTRLGTRIAAQIVAKKKPSLGKHAGALTSIGALAAIWLLAYRVKFLHKYHTPIVVGSAIATLASLIQLYIPRLGWMMDVTADPKQVAAGSQVPQDMTPLEGEDPENYVYDDRYDPGVHGSETVGSQRQYHPPTGAGPATHVTGDDMLDMEMEDEDAQTQGIFGGQN
jgi:hypothetical protein